MRRDTRACRSMGSRQYPSRQQQSYMPGAACPGPPGPAMLDTTNHTAALPTTDHPRITPKCSFPVCMHTGVKEDTFTLYLWWLHGKAAVQSPSDVQTSFIRFK